MIFYALMCQQAWVLALRKEKLSYIPRNVACTFNRKTCRSSRYSVLQCVMFTRTGETTVAYTFTVGTFYVRHFADLVATVDERACGSSFWVSPLDCNTSLHGPYTASFPRREMNCNSCAEVCHIRKAFSRDLECACDRIHWSRTAPVFWPDFLHAPCMCVVTVKHACMRTLPCFTHFVYTFLPSCMLTCTKYIVGYKYIKSNFFNVAKIWVRD